MVRSETEALADDAAPARQRGRGGRIAAITLVSAAGLAAVGASLRQPIAEALVRGWFKGKGLSGDIEISQLDFSGVKVEGLRLSQGGEEALSLAAVTVLFNWRNILSPEIAAIELDRPVLHVDIGAGGVDLNGLDKLQPAPSGERKPPPPINLRNGRIEISTPAGIVTLDVDITGGGEKPLRVTGRNAPGPGNEGRTALSFGEWRGDLAGFSFNAEITPEITRGTFAIGLGGAFAPGFRAEKGELAGNFRLDDAGLDGAGVLKLARIGQAGLEIRDLVVDMRALRAQFMPPLTPKGDAAAPARGKLAGWKIATDIAAGSLRLANDSRIEGVAGNLTLSSHGEAGQGLRGQWRGRVGAFVPGADARKAMLPAFASDVGFTLDGLGTERRRADLDFALTSEAQSATSPVMALIDRSLAIGLPEPLAGEWRDWRAVAAAALVSGAELRGRIRAEASGRNSALRLRLDEPVTLKTGSGLRAALAPAQAAAAGTGPFLALVMTRSGPGSGEFELVGTPALRIEGPDAPFLDLAATALTIDAREMRGEFTLTYRSRPDAANQLHLQAGEIRLAFSQEGSAAASPSGTVTIGSAPAQFSGEIYSVGIDRANLLLDGEMQLDADGWRFVPALGCLPLSAKAADAALVHVGAFETRLCAGSAGLLRGGRAGAGGGFRISGLSAPLRLGAAEEQGDGGSGATGTPLFAGTARIPVLDLRFEAGGNGVRTVILVPEFSGEGNSLLDPRLRMRAGISNINALASADGQWRAFGTSENIALAGDKLAFRMADGVVKFEASPLDPRRPEEIRVKLPELSAILHDVAAPSNFAPVRAAGSGELAGDHFVADFAPMSGKTGLGTLKVQADLAAGTGKAELHSGPLSFERGGLQPRNLAPILAGQINDAVGVAEADFTFLWGPDAPATGAGQIAVRDFAFANLATGPVTGLDTILKFDDLLTLATAPAQRLTIGTLNPGLPIEGVEVTYSIRPADPRAGNALPTLLIESARIPVASGALILQDAVAPLTAAAAGEVSADPNSAPILRFPLVVEGIELQELLDLMKIKDWKATGAISGRLPLEIQGTRTRIVNGVVSADGGVVQGDPVTLDLLSSRPAGVVGPTGPRRFGFFGPRLPTERELAFQGLKDFTYEKLSVGINGDLTGDLALTFNLSGRGRALFDNLPLNYTMVSRFNAADIQRGFRLAERVSRGATAKSLIEDVARQVLEDAKAKEKAAKGVNAGP